MQLWLPLSLSLLMQAEWGEQITASLDGQALFSQHCSGFTQHPPSEPPGRAVTFN